MTATAIITMLENETIRRLQFLAPKFAIIVTGVIAQADRAIQLAKPDGGPITILETWRTPVRTAALNRRGESRQKPFADPYNFGLACKVGIREQGANRPADLIEQSILHEACLAKGAAGVISTDGHFIILSNDWKTIKPLVT